MKPIRFMLDNMENDLKFRDTPYLVYIKHGRHIAICPLTKTSKACIFVSNQLRNTNKNAKSTILWSGNSFLPFWRLSVAAIFDLDTSSIENTE